LEILASLGYDVDEVSNKLKGDLTSSSFITEQEKDDTLAKLELFLQQNGYLRTTN
jgi:arginine decarboxylase